MSYIPALPRNAVAPAVGASLDAVQKKLGVLPNMFRTFAHTPVALNAYLQLAEVAASGRFDAKQRELIALAVGDRNGCDYCLAAHGAIGRMVGLAPGEIAAARAASATRAGDAAVLALAQRIVDARGHVPTAELDAFKAAGFDDAAILEVLVNVVLNIYTNYTNHLARTDIDFPAAPAAHAA
ncbi:putative peroxidase-related enzyme [Dokdonella fugitiva]|uniref:Putative peroxidase-related enzyme n=1 Tax=Dokdonella fugitiva TaxID=328517 RepID=A0A839EQK0_9GAMM|nr:carboxymuconolactone decarboxylase family protein [Dokdonella fugitiva]MBA8886597.1 putative peroxidase-related enzyme [Dokdonella fugitiva]